MIFLKIMGNCGNQFFQYAFARRLQELYGGELVIDYGLIKDVPGMWEGSDNLLANFNTVPYEYSHDDKKNPHKLITKLIRKTVALLKLQAYTVKTYRFCLFCAHIFEKYGVYYFSAAYYPFKYNSISHNIAVNGYYESPKYFDEIDTMICSELTPKEDVLAHNFQFYQTICKSESVCISIKRMDVNNDEISDIYDYDINFFYYAIDYIRSRIENPVWIVFSDDIEWCKKNIQIDGEVFYERGDDPIWEKMRLMSSCKHFIIHNSTFSWWAQHLSGNRNKIVVVPAKWMNRNDQPIDIYENHFIYMDNLGNVIENHM